MNWMIRLVASPALKQSVAIALKVMSMIRSAMMGILAGDQISDTARKNIESVLAAIAVVHDFVWKLSDILGLSPYEMVQGYNTSGAVNKEAVDQLIKAIEKL